MCLGSAFPQSSATAADTAIAKQNLVSPVARIRTVSREVYRLLVDIDGAIKGGTAFLVSGQRIVATNNHVIEGGTAYWLGYSDANGHSRRMPLRLLASYPQKDLALLEALDDLPGQPLPLASLCPEVASDLYAIGFPAAADPQGALSLSTGDDESFFVPSVLKGNVSRVLNNRWLTTQLQHQTPIVPGYSGGPLVNDDGVVVGISTSIHKEANGISYAVLAADLVEFAKACSVPVHANQALPRPVADRQPATPTPETMNTYALQQPQQPRPLVSEEDLAALSRAGKLLNEGAVVSSRLICQHLVRMSHAAEAYTCLARTYDPEVLHGLRVVGFEGDIVLAKLYYTQANKVREEWHDKLAEVAPSVQLTRDGACDASACRLINQANGPAVFCQRKSPN